jgi:hypothetical protein
LAARWRPYAKMTSPFDSPTSILFELPVEIFRLSLNYRSKVIRVYLFGWKFGSRVPKFRVFGGF